MFPKEEIYGLTSQIKRCAVSIPSNIAEGSQRSTKKDFSNFSRIAQGSCAELETQLMLARRLNFIKQLDLLQKSMENLIEIRKMLSGLIKKLQSD